MSDANLVVETMIDKSVITFLYADYYKFFNKAKIKMAYLENLRDELKQHSILMAWGNSVVVFAKDFNFSPVPNPKKK